MAKPKQKYFIYEEEYQDYGDGHLEHFKRKIGTTWAVSDKQAVNNWCYRNGRYAMEHADWYGDGGRDTFIIAELE